MRLRMMIALLAVLTACAPCKELDREFGKASQAAWEAQIVNKNHPYGDQVPEGMAGITAEETMNVRNKSFAERPKREDIFRFKLTK